MTLSAQLVLAVIGAGATVATVIFYGAFYLGQIWHRIAALETTVDEHEKAIQEFKSAA